MADKIDELAALDDTELAKALGIADKVSKARKDLDEMQKLSGEARKIALERVEKMFKPNIYPEEFNWITKDAEREAERKAKTKAKDCNCTGADLLDPEMYPDLKD